MAKAPSSSSSSGDNIAAAVAPVSAALQTDANAVAGEAKAVLSQVKDEASTQITQLADQAKEQVSKATEQVKSVAAEQKDLLAAQIGGVADAMQRVATDLESSGSASAPYARMIADNAEQLSSTVRNNDVDQIMAKAQDFGRRQPVAFMGASALLGFAASRFLLASANRATSAPVAAAQSANPTTPSTTYEPGRV